MQDNSESALGRLLRVAASFNPSFNPSFNRTAYGCRLTQTLGVSGTEAVRLCAFQSRYQFWSAHFFVVRLRWLGALQRFRLWLLVFLFPMII